MSMCGYARAVAVLTKRVTVLCLCILAWLVASGATATGAAATTGAFGWGANALGQLGNGTDATARLPTTVSVISEVKAVAAGTFFSVGLLENGTVYTWGAGGSGQLGDGTTRSSEEPVHVSDLTEVTAIAAGGSHALALTKTGHVYAWGSNQWGQLGNGSTEKSDEPLEIKGLTEVIAIAAGSSFSLALKKDGEVVAWGANGFGQLGDGSSSGPEKCRVSEEVGELEEQSCSRTPVSVVGLNKAATAIAADGQHALALLEGGTVEAWGENALGQLGDRTNSGPEVCTIIIEKEGKSANEEEPCSRSPVAVKELSEATAIAAGGLHSLAIVSGGYVYAWGAGGSGQLGDGKEEGSDVPVRVAKIARVIAIAGGGSHSLALLEGDTVDAWGANESGQLGDEMVKNSDEPAPVVHLEEATCIAAGSSFSLACGPHGPIVTELEPASGPLDGGNRVCIHGEYLTKVVEVLFGSNPPTKIEEISSTELCVTAPAGKKLGAVSVKVVTKHGANPIGAGTPKYRYASVVLPTFGRCVKVATGTGKYSDAGCTEKSTGNYEWHTGPGSLNHFSDSGGSVTLENIAGTKMTCTKSSATGEYFASAFVTKVTLTFAGCAIAGSKCTSHGAKEGEVVSNALEGELGWQERATNKVALNLEPAGEAEYLIEATCGTTSLKVGGSVIGAITTVNKMEKSFKLKFKETSGEQDIEHFEELPNDVLEMTYGISKEQAGLALELTLSNEEELEINTLVA